MVRTEQRKREIKETIEKNLKRRLRRSAADQIRILNQRLGLGVGAKKERARLSKRS